MENVIYVLVGILSAVFSYSVGYSVIGVFKGNRKQRELQNELIQLGLSLGSIEHDLHSRMDMRDKEVDDELNDIRRQTDGARTHDLANLDSRLDKLEDRIIKKIPPTNEELSVRIDKVKDDLQRFITLYNNQ